MMLVYPFLKPKLLLGVIFLDSFLFHFVKVDEMLKLDEMLKRQSGSYLKVKLLGESETGEPHPETCHENHRISCQYFTVSIILPATLM